MPMYYETEQPIEAVSDEHGEVRYFKGAGKLQVARPKWISAHDGQLHHGKTVTINIDKFLGDPAMIGVLEMVLADLKNGNKSNT